MQKGRKSKLLDLCILSPCLAFMENR